MSELPETRDSLLVQLREADNAAAWEQFCAVYRPAMYRLARRRGLQDAEADDLAQQVMVNVSRAIGGWQKDAEQGTFRGWLLRIARNAILNALTRGRPDAARGGSGVVESLAKCPAVEDAESLIDDEHRRAVFRWAAAEVKPEFQEATWLAFWLTTIEERSVERAAAELGKSVGSVYAARSRVMRRLREKAREFEE
ncbi:MAG: RNA polymerase sigma factor [Pirellulaceae bacterium]